MKNKVYEITLAGFNRGTDITDDQIIWVAAQGEAPVGRLCARMKIKFDSIEPTDLDPSDAGIDFVIENTKLPNPSPKFCPYCGDRNLRIHMVEWGGTSKADPDNIADLDEHQCETCGCKSFWT